MILIIRAEMQRGWKKETTKHFQSLIPILIIL